MIQEAVRCDPVSADAAYQLWQSDMPIVFDNTSDKHGIFINAGHQCSEFYTFSVKPSNDIYNIYDNTISCTHTILPHEATHFLHTKSGFYSFFHHYENIGRDKFIEKFLYGECVADFNAFRAFAARDLNQFNGRG